MCVYIYILYAKHLGMLRHGPLAIPTAAFISFKIQDVESRYLSISALFVILLDLIYMQYTKCMSVIYKVHVSNEACTLMRNLPDMLHSMSFTPMGCRT